MSKGFRAPPTDTDLRPLYRFRSSSNSSSSAAANTRSRASPGADWPTRGPPGGDRSGRPASGAQWSNRSNRPSASSDWSNRQSSAPQWSSDGALSVLNSCGLDPSDLSLLAELPENMLTVKSLPHVLSQIKGHKKDRPVNAPPYQPTGSTTRQLPSQSQASYQGPGQSQTAFSSSAGVVVDYGHRVRAQDFGKTPERPGRSSQTSQAFSPHGSKELRRSSEISQAMGTVKISPAPQFFPSGGVSVSTPSEKQARDFHGLKPSGFPYSCSLCDITVLSEAVWTQHINGTQHADGQLALLQRFPSWDCRLASVSKSDSKELNQASIKPSNTNLKEKELSKKPQKKALKGKVVCVKFPPRSMDEPQLRKLIEPFGEKVNVAMFPSLGFIELESAEQAQNVISFYTNTPHKVNGQEIEFSISNTFNFLQSSFVVNFSPVPFGKEGQSDLLTVIKPFGTLLYSMFLPEKMQAFVEMQNAADAHKLVEYYSSTPLRINGVHINVSFSQEYRTLERCALAKPCKEDSLIKPEQKRPQKKHKKQKIKLERENLKKERSVSREKTQVKFESERRESRDRERSEEDRNKTEPKKGTEKLTLERQNKDRSVSKGVESKTETKNSSEKPIPERQKKEVASKDVGNNRETQKPTEKTDSNKATEKPTTGGQKTEEGDKDRSSVPRETEQKRNSHEKTSTNQKKEAEERQKKQTEDTQDSLSEEGSDIEGMQVMGEHLDDEEERKDDEDEDPEFPFDLENCITLDEVHDSDEYEEEEVVAEVEKMKDEDESSPRVVFIGKLPLCDYSDSQFLQMVQIFAKPVRYFLNKPQRMGLVEMRSTDEAVAFCRHMKNFDFKGSAIKTFLSNKYNRLYKGREVRDSLDSGSTRLRCSSRNRSKSPNDRESRSKQSKAESKEKNPPKTQEKCEETDKNDARKELTPQTAQEKPANHSEAVKKDFVEPNEVIDEEGWVVYNNLDEEEEQMCEKIKIENVVSLKGKDLEEKKEELIDAAPDGEEDGWLVWTDAEETANDERVDNENKMATEKEPTVETENMMVEDKIKLQEERLDQNSTDETKAGLDQESVKMDVGKGPKQMPLNQESTNEKAMGENLILTNGQDLASAEEEGWPVSNLSGEEEFLSCDKVTDRRTGEDDAQEQNQGHTKNLCEGVEGETNGAVLEKRGMEEQQGAKEGGAKAVKRKGSIGAEVEGRPEKKLKVTVDSQQDSTLESVPTGSGATGTKMPNKPIGTEFIRFYCNLCHVIYSDEHEARVSHCSSLQHYQKYKELTGKDPWAETELKTAL